jgi:hypothetical protein
MDDQRFFALSSHHAGMPLLGARITMPRSTCGNTALSRSMRRGASQSLSWLAA